MFLSFGPKFNFETTIEPFSSIELYNLMCGEFVGVYWQIIIVYYVYSIMKYYNIILLC